MSSPGTNTCEYAHLDGAYVLGALAAAERAEYERHLRGCDECTRALRDLAGIPGLLGRVPLEELDESDPPEPVPQTLLPSVVAEARRAQDRRRLTAILAAAAAVVVLALVGVTVALVGDDRGSGSTAVPTPAASTAPAERMESLGTPSFGWVSLTERGWGTQIDLTCTYEGKLAGRTTYVLVVRSGDGTTERVGSWAADRGKEVHVTMASSVPPDDIAAVEVQTESGYPVLRLVE